jgi:2-dehydropantoate 2-reductase
VVGAGAVGLGLSSCLLAAGVELQLQLRRREAAEALRRDGLRRTGLFGDSLASPGSFAVSTDDAQLAAFDPDAVLVCTKATDREGVASWLGALWPSLRSRPAVVLCLNGWGHAERFAQALPEDRIFNATVTTGFRRRGWSEVEVTVHGDDLHMGSLFGAATEAVEPLCDRLTRGGLPSSVSGNMAAEIWAKLLYNCALNPLAALLGVPYGALGEQAGSREILCAVVRELFAVLEASGHATRWAGADDYLAYFFGELLPATRSHESSMLQDLRAGRETEIEALSGAVVALGRRFSVATPVNAALATLVRSLHPRGAGAA